MVDSDDDSDYKPQRNESWNENQSISSDEDAGSNGASGDDEEEESRSSSSSSVLNDLEESTRSILSELIESIQYGLATERCRMYPDEVLLKDYEGWTSMHFLCMTLGRDTELSLDLVHAMIKAVPLSKSMSDHDNSGNTPFHYFCEDVLYASHMPTMITILELFLNDERSNVAEYVNNESMLPLHTIFCCSDSALKPLPSASELLAVIHKVLHAYPAAASKACSESGMLPLHMACRYFVPNLVDNENLHKAIVEVMKSLILSFPDAVTKRDLSNRFPLHHLSKHADPAHNPAISDIYHLLIEHNPSLVMKRNRWGESPIDTFWVEHVDGELIDDVKFKVGEVMLRAAYWGALEDSSIGLKWLPIHAAVRSTCPRNFLEELVRRYPKQLTMRDENGDTPLHIYLQYRLHEGTYDREDYREEYRIKFLFILLQNHRIASMPDACGRLPLHIALERGCLDWENGLRLLTDSAPTAVSTRDIESHFYPFMFAAMAFRLDLCYQLLRNSPGVLGMLSLSLSESSGDCSSKTDAIRKSKRQRK